MTFLTNPALNSLFEIVTTIDYTIITPDGYTGPISGIKSPETCNGLIGRNSNLISVVANVPTEVIPFSKNIVIEETSDTLVVEEFIGTTVLQPVYLDGQVIQDFSFDALTGTFDFSAIHELTAGSLLTVWYTLQPPNS